MKQSILEFEQKQMINRKLQRSELQRELQAQIIQNMVVKDSKFKTYNLLYKNHDERFEIWFKFILEVIKKLNYSMDTFYLALQMFDSISSRFFLPKPQLKIFSILVLDIAAKMKETRNHYVDLIERQYDLPYLGRFSNRPKTELLEMQKSIIIFFNFELNIHTVMNFLPVLIANCNDLNGSLDAIISYDTPCFETSLVSKLVFSASFFYDSNMFSCVGLACALVFCLRSMLGFKEPWPLVLKRLTNVDANQLTKAIHFVFKSYNWVFESIGEIKLIRSGSICD